jgi:hypothetical protein
MRGCVARCARVHSRCSGPCRHRDTQLVGEAPISFSFCNLMSPRTFERIRNIRSMSREMIEEQYGSGELMGGEISLLYFLLS